MRFEVEVIAEEVLPAVRSMIADNLHEDYGFKQREIANRLGVTQPAVSNYLNNSRADQKIVQKISSDPQIQLLLEEATDKAVDNENYASEVSQIIWNIRDKGLIKERFENTEKII